MLNLSRKTICLAAALCLAPAGTAVAAPAGNEYLPQAPSATGGKDESSGGQGGGGGGDGTGATETFSLGGGSGDSGGGTGDGGAGGSSGDADGGKSPKANGLGTEDGLPDIPRDEEIAALTAAAQEDDGESGALDTLLDPPVLGAIALAAIVLAALLMRRRRSRIATPRPPGPGVPDPKGT